MTTPIKLISTDFDGTIFAEFENPPIAPAFQELIGRLQAQGAKWVINTGRDMSSLMEALGRARAAVHPDFLVLVEREIYVHEHSTYVSVAEWNDSCHQAHAELYSSFALQVPPLLAWVNARYPATTVYADSYSPFCMIAGDNGEADAIQTHIDEFRRAIPNLAFVRNDVYARFCHADYNKGTALAAITRRLGLRAEDVFAAGDHLNDLPMLDRRFAGFLASPANAVQPVKAALRAQGGFISTLSQGNGVAEGLAFHLHRGA
jgi:HAD superfamily hydrolase (TIGR01484 family)